MSKVEEKVEMLVTKPIEELGYKVYDVIYTKEGKDNYLKIFIDRDAGISLDDCEVVNNAITDILDEADYIKEQYFLEISSPGLERLIRKDKHLEENIGEDICVKTFTSVEGSKENIGTLKKFDDSVIFIEVQDKNIEIPRENIALIKKVYNWD